MKQKIYCILSLSLAAAACGDETPSGVDGGVVGSPDGSVGNNPPAAPVLGALIDRMGRPGVNTAVTDPFSAAAPSDMKKDEYNVTPAAEWAAKYSTSFAGNIAIYDGLDQNCGNQFAAGPAGAGRYNALAGVLADDRLYVNTAATMCSVYLGVEANATAIIPNMDCGGRTPAYDVIDVTYSVLAIGGVSGVTDGITNDSTFATTFPFFAAPN